MPSVGRNDPCPCGSGKKYKRCHWRIDQQIQSQNLQLERAWHSLGLRIWRFGTQQRFVDELRWAWELFWDNRVAIEALPQLDDLLQSRFLDWYSFNHRTSRHRRIAGLFLEERGAELSPLERDLIRDWSETYTSVYEVIDAATADVELQDVFTGDGKVVREERGIGVLPAGLLLAARLLPVGGALRLAPGATAIPGHAKNDLRAFIEPRFKAWQQARYGANWRDFLSEAGYLLNHFLIRDMEPVPPPPLEEPAMDPWEAARSIARRMQGEVITTSLDLHYARWLDRSVPEWGGKTPRQMAATPEHAQMVEVLFDYLEEIEQGRAQSGQPTYNVGLLRRRLGMAGELRTEGGIILPRQV